MIPPLRVLRRALGRLYHSNRQTIDRIGIAILVARRTACLLLVSPHSLKKPYLVMGSAAYLPGLFSEFTAVLGLLDHYERWSSRYAGVRVDMGSDGRYFDPSLGSNWWEYYFEPVRIGNDSGSATRRVGTLEHMNFAERTSAFMTKERGNELIRRYIRPTADVLEAVDRFIGEQWGDRFIIGVHYRGTDKYEETPLAPYDAVDAEVRRILAKGDHKNPLLFIATDERAFIDFMLGCFPGMVTYTSARRSTDGSPVHYQTTENGQKGREAVVDCLLLSRCDRLIRTASNLSLCSTMFSPTLREQILNPPLERRV